MVSISTLYLTLQSSLSIVYVSRIEKARRNRMTLYLGNRGNTHGFHEFYARFFAKYQVEKLQFLPYSSRFFYLTFANTSKHELSDEIRHSSFTSSMLHEAAWCIIHRYALHSHYRYRHLSWRKYDEEEKLPDLCSADVFQLPSRRISRRWTRSGTKVVVF